VRELVVNADDLGLSPGVNRGIARAHVEGIVTSASLMVRQPAAEDAAELVHQLPKLGVGLHVDLAEWMRRPSGWEPLYAFVDDQDQAAVTREVEQQLVLFENLVGRAPDHLDSHQHAHRSEPLRSILGRAAEELRVPLRFHSRFVYFGGFYGQSGDGRPFIEAISSQGLCTALAKLSEGATELCCHPAAEIDFQSSYGAERLQELEALCSEQVRREIATGGFGLDSFGGHRAQRDAIVDGVATKGKDGTVLGSENGLASAYEPATYWVERHSQLKGDIRSVGNRGVSVAENEKGYVNRAAVLSHLLTEDLSVARGSTLIEFGCGIGMQAPVIVDAGLEYTGVDISPDALAAARRRCSEGSFIQADVRAFRPDSTFDLALAGYVLCHMVADSDWSSLLANLAASVRSGGHVIIEERIPEDEPIQHGDYVLARPFEDYAKAFRDLGLTMIEALCSRTLLVAVRSNGGRRNSISSRSPGGSSPW
jgi:chitin disaccharide deacetylase